MRSNIKFRLLLVVISGLFFMSSCAVRPPSNVDNVCSIFKCYPKWYWATQDVEKKWGVPIAVQMAIIHQESRFRAKAKPPRRKLLGCIPWFRPTSAFGYTQALTTTWGEYRKKTGHGHASRKSFRDAVDFIGWYTDQVCRTLNISRSNAYAIYLAYHEGIGGFRGRTYLKKPWLVHVAKKVSYRSRRYARQLAVCRPYLKKRHFWNVF